MPKQRKPFDDPDEYDADPEIEKMLDKYERDEHPRRLRKQQEHNKDADNARTRR